MDDPKVKQLFEALSAIGNVVDLTSPTGKFLGRAVEMPRQPDQDSSMAIIFLEGEDALHLHWATEETYLFFIGTGSMATGGGGNVLNFSEVTPGLSRWIPTGTWHAVAPKDGPMVFAVVSEPAFDPTDFVPHPEKVSGWSE